MKKMVFLTIGMVSILGSSAFADMKCVAQATAGNPTVSLEFNANHYYTISMYGHSRNTYKAIYEAATPSGALKKVVDQSTWNDMPNHLRLTGNLVKVEPGYIYELVGLPVGKVQFSEYRNCVSE